MKAGENVAAAGTMQEFIQEMALYAAAEGAVQRSADEADLEPRLALWRWIADIQDEEMRQEFRRDGERIDLFPVMPAGQIIGDATQPGIHALCPAISMASSNPQSHPQSLAHSGDLSTDVW